MQKTYVGGRKPKDARGPKQTEAQDGRQQQNRNHKADFRSGKGTMRSPAALAMSKRAAVKRPGKETTNG